MSDLFPLLAPSADTVPLAEKLRPSSFEQVVGQQHLLGEGKPLRLAFEAKRLHSMILWGPPGVGKTTLARLMAKYFDADFIALSAVFSGVKEIREAVSQAQKQRQLGRQTILFVDEVHRFNKAQQDAFLPYVEQGIVTFVGATTENPSFELNAALLSRASVYVLHSLEVQDLLTLFKQAWALNMLERDTQLEMSNDAQQQLIHSVDGDARRLLNLIEQVQTAAYTAQKKHIDSVFLQQVLAIDLRRFDKGGDYFYDQISALHKSIRGSNPDAALYWLCRMLDGGADPLYLARRLVRMASEDIGLADPRALEISLNACACYERLGSPEGELALVQAAVYLACAAKSNAVYKAYKEVRQLIAKDKTRPVPMHLRNAPTKLAESLGHSHGYRYAHDEPHGYAAGEKYLPEGLATQRWYHPVDRGMEFKIREKLAWLRALDEDATH